MAEWVKYLSHKQAWGPEFRAQHPHENGGMKEGACNTNAEDAEVGGSLKLAGCILVELASSKPTENPVF